MTRLQWAGAVVAACGFVLAFAMPWISQHRAGADEARLLVFDREDGGWERGWRPVQLDLTPVDNPVRIMLDARLSPTSPRRDEIAMAIVIAKDGAILREQSFGLPIVGASDRHGVTAPLPEFSVPNAGRYTVTIRSTEAEDIGFLGADAWVLRGKTGDLSRWRLPGYGAIAIGALVFGIGSITTAKRRRRKRRRRR